jgi:hypothetical protein
VLLTSRHQRPSSVAYQQAPLAAADNQHEMEQGDFATASSNLRVFCSPKRCTPSMGSA